TSSSADSSSSSDSSSAESDEDENNNKNNNNDNSLTKIAKKTLALRKKANKLIKKTQQKQNETEMNDNLSNEEDDDDDEDEDETSSNKEKRQPKYIKTKDEVTIEELPAPEKIQITLEPDVKLDKIGRVVSKVDKLVIIQSLREN